MYFRDIYNITYCRYNKALERLVVMKKRIFFVMLYVFMIGFQGLILAENQDDGIMKITTDNTGNIFGYNEDVIIDISLNGNGNIYSNATVSWDIYNDETNEAVLSNQQVVQVAANQETNIQISAAIDNYGLYRIDAEFNCDNITETETLRFSKIFNITDGEQNTDFMFASHIWKGSMYNPAIELMKKAGVGGWSDGITWENVEKVEGTRKLNSANYSAFINSESNKENMLILAYGNTNIVKRKDGSGNLIETTEVYPPITEDELNSFGKYCSFIASESKKSVHRFQIWNEWELESFNPEKLSGADYVKVLKVAYESIKSVYPEAEVVGMSGSILSSNGDFDREALASGALNYCDSISIHAYDYHRSSVFPNQRFLDDLSDRVALYRSYMSDKAMPIYISEIGWSTATKTDNLLKALISEKDKAENLVKTFFVTKAYDIVDKIYWYDFQDDGEDPEDRSSRYGVVTSKHNQEGAFLAKPAYLATAAMNKLTLGGISSIKNDKYNNYVVTEKVDSVWGDNKKIDAYTTAAYVFKREGIRTEYGSHIAVLWSKGQSNFVVSTGCNEINLFDIYGNKNVLTSETGIYSIDLNNKVAYLTGNFKMFNVNNQSVVVNDVQYDANKNLISVSGRANNLQSVDIELYKNGVEVQTVNTNIKDDGSFSATISALEDGEYTVYVGKKTVEAFVTWGETVSVQKNNGANSVTSIANVVISGNGNNIRVSGNVVNANDNDTASLLIVRRGENVSTSTPLYIGEVELNQSGAFEKDIVLPVQEKSVDVYICSNFADKVSGEYSYDIAFVASVNIEELSTKIYATANVKNFTANKKEGRIIIAQYDSNEDGAKIIDIDIKPFSVDATGSSGEMVSHNVEKDSNATYCKVFVWDGFASMSPLFDVTSRDLN